MISKKLTINNKQADGYEIPMGKFNLVFIRTDKGMIGCGAFDADALDKFAYPAVIMKSSDGSAIARTEDLLSAEVKHANKSAMEIGISQGMRGKDVLEKM